MIIKDIDILKGEIQEIDKHFSEFELMYYTSDDGIWIIHKPCEEEHLLPWGDSGLDKALAWSEQHKCK